MAHMSGDETRQKLKKMKGIFFLVNCVRHWGTNNRHLTQVFVFVMLLLLLSSSFLSFISFSFCVVLFCWFLFVCLFVFVNCPVRSDFA